MSKSEYSGDRNVTNGTSPRSHAVTAMAPRLSSFSNATFDLGIPQAQAALVNSSANSCQVNGLNSGTPMLALPDSSRISPGSAQCSQSIFQPSSHGNGNPYTFFSDHPDSNVLIIGGWQQMLLSTASYTSAITSMLPSSSEPATSSPNSKPEFYAYNHSTCPKESKKFSDPGFSASIQLKNADHEFDDKGGSCPTLKNGEGSSEFGQANGENDAGNPAHKRSFIKAKLKELSSATATVDDKASIPESSLERQKHGEPAKNGDNKSILERIATENSANSTPGAVREGSKPPEPQKTDYIHVRARRGQATDSHSLAERVRREKISERMKFLQDLVPGCDKITGKAVMLDEIINYVQSLQRQVEFLSMKLAAVNSRVEFNLDSLEGPILQSLTSTVQPASNCSKNQQQKPIDSQASLKGVPLPNVPSQQLPILAACTEAYGDVSQKKRRWDSELQRIVQMGFSQIRQCPLDSQDLQGGHMKAEI